MELHLANSFIKGPLSFRKGIEGVSRDDDDCQGVGFRRTYCYIGMLISPTLRDSNDETVYSLQHPSTNIEMVALVWAVLKPVFLALLGDPFDTKPLEKIVFDVLPASDGNGEDRVSLAAEVKVRNPLRHAFKVTCTKSSAKVKNWVAAINDAGLRPPEGWCHPHCFGSFAPPRGLTEDGSQAQWFVDVKAAFDAIAS
ncbi:Phospholipase D family [Corchorus capsularis]|uniref:Phospholipase D family n=1 Tax=Corchorus capsularis TaxID=210143 RepID=A0A1R3GCC4_COCAP|nr:Phospholipase D family [Corchorus capsularis]